MVGPVGVAIGRTTLEDLINRIADPLFGMLAIKHFSKRRHDSLMNGKTFQGIVRQEKFEISFLLVLRILIVCRLVIQIAIRRRVFYRNVFFDRLLIGEAYGFGGKLVKEGVLIDKIVIQVIPILLSKFGMKRQKFRGHLHHAARLDHTHLDLDSRNRTSFLPQRRLFRNRSNPFVAISPDIGLALVLIRHELEVKNFLSRGHF